MFLTKGVGYHGCHDPQERWRSSLNAVSGLNFSDAPAVKELDAVAEKMSHVHRVAVLFPLAVGARAVLCTICIHALAVDATVNFVRHEKRLGYAGAGRWTNLAIVVPAISFLFVAHPIEIAVWSALFILCGEFREFGIAYYHSAVNYTTLGYSDLIMSPSWRLLRPVEAADGALMFGVSTAMVFTVILRLIRTFYVDLKD